MIYSYCYTEESVNSQSEYRLGYRRRVPGEKSLSDPDNALVRELLGRATRHYKTQVATGRALGISQAHVSSILKGTRGAGMSVIRELARMYPDEAHHLLASASVEALPPAIQFAGIDEAIDERTRYGLPAYDERTVAHARELATRMWADPGIATWRILMRAYEEAHAEAWAEEAAEAQQSSRVRRKSGAKRRKGA